MSSDRPLSVVICTYNPRAAVLGDVIDALRGQTLPMTQWDLLVVDNRSTPPVSDLLDLAWHDAGRVAVESEPGLTAARHRAIHDTDGDVIVFVDDDNVLDLDYLERCQEIATEYPVLGAWGGQLIEDPAIVIPPELHEFVPLLGIRHLDEARWASFPDPESTPFGAGLCVRRLVAKHYVESSAASSLRMSLGIRSGDLFRCEDIDLAWTSCDIGLGVGVFPSLKLTHRLDPSRFDLEYARRLVVGHEISFAMLNYVRFGIAPELPARDRVGKRARLANYLRLVRIAAPSPLEEVREEGQRQAFALFTSGAFDA